MEALLLATALLATALLTPSEGAPAPRADELGKWRIEAQVPVRIAAKNGVLEIDGREGITVWLKRRLRTPVRITFQVKAIAKGGPNDAVSDVNAFWMARERDGAAPRVRGGRFEDYDTLRTYYVGVGGNRNTSTRMRRYVGRAGDRPLLPEHDRADAAALLVPNAWMRLELVADGTRAIVVRDGCVLFVLDDPAPYREGWFGLRTTRSHLAVRNVRIDAHADVSRTPRCPAPPPAPDREAARDVIPAIATP